MALPTDVLGQFASDANQIFAGQTSDVWILPGGLNPQPPSFYPVHGLSLNGIPAQPAVIVTRNATGGVTAVAQVSTITVGSNPSADETFSLDPDAGGGGAAVVFTFKASASLETEITIGGTTTETATNIATKLSNHSTIGTAITATSATNVVTITADVAGTPFTITEALAGLTTATVTANVIGVKATAIIQPQGSRHKGSTINQITIIMEVGTSGPQRVKYQFDTPSDSTTNAQIATGLKAILDAGINETAIPAGSRIISSNLLNTRTEIAAAMVNLFAADTSFVVASDILTISAGSTGVNGNNISFSVITLPSLPGSIVQINTSGVPQTDGIPIHLGAQDGFQAVVTPQTIDINASNFVNRFARITTGQALDINFKLFQDNSLELTEISTNRATIASNDTTDVLLFGGQPLPSKFAVIFTSPSKNVGGSFDVLVIYNCEASSVTINRAKGQANGFDVKLSPNALNRQGDSVGYLAQVRSL